MITFPFFQHTVCEVISARGAEVCIAVYPAVNQGSIVWYDQTGRDRSFELQKIVRDQPREFAFISNGVKYALVPMTVRAWNARIMRLLDVGPRWSPGSVESAENIAKILKYLTEVSPVQ